MDPLRRYTTDEIGTVLPEKKQKPEQIINTILTKINYIEIDKNDINKLTDAVKKINTTVKKDITKLNKSKKISEKDELIRRIENYAEVFKALPQRAKDTALDQKLKKFHRELVKPNQTKCLSTLGICYLQDREFDRALNVFSTALDLNPDQAEHYLNYAEAFIQKDEWDHAREVCERGKTYASLHHDAPWSKKLTSKMTERLAQIIAHQRPW